MPRRGSATSRADLGGLSEPCGAFAPSAWIVTLFIVIGLLQGCATPTERADSFAASHGFSRAVVRGAEFRHVVFRNANHDDSQPLHVYIEGDGIPYLDRWTVATDPTSRNPVMLHLMALDASPAVYVGRPCYFGLATELPCTPADWTLGRFSERVVESLAAVIDGFMRSGGYQSLELFGHSGGGTLAVLLAGRLQGVSRVVTVAGNLDPDTWARFHEYSPLSTSVNPVLQPALPASIRQLHVAGAMDRNVPAWMVEQAAPKLGRGDVVVFPEADHTCCWAGHWPTVLVRW